MKNVIDLNLFKVNKENEVLFYLKKKIKEESCKEKETFFKNWLKVLSILSPIHVLLSLVLYMITKQDIVFQSIVSFAVFNFCTWIVLEIIQKCNGSVIFTNHFENQKKLLILDKEFDLSYAVTTLKLILIMNCAEDFNVDTKELAKSFKIEPNFFLDVIKSDNYKKFKYKLQKTNNVDYSTLVNVEKDFIKLNKEINLLYNVSKKDLRKIS